MKEYLVFRLYGPLASWGQAAVGGDRPTGIVPTRSAILGLLGAALGIKREEEKQLQALQSCVKVAVKQAVPTSLMRDYHTSQVPSHNKKMMHRTRKSELSENKLNTILSSRDYRCDGLWVVAISIAGGDLKLTKLQQALKTPVYMLSLGRKSCPLALPLAPEIALTNSLKKALDTEFPPLSSSHAEDRFRLNANGWVTYFWEGEKDEFAGRGVITTKPWDEPVSRDRWQFKQRIMHQLSIKEENNVSV
jgi:CRISPR system Cascade subunit CasD